VVVLGNESPGEFVNRRPAREPAGVKVGDKLDVVEDRRRLRTLGKGRAGARLENRGEDKGW